MKVYIYVLYLHIRRNTAKTAAQRTKGLKTKMKYSGVILKSYKSRVLKLPIVIFIIILFLNVGSTYFFELSRRNDDLYESLSCGIL